MSTRLFTSESVTKGHPDKLCDQVSDAILDAILSKDKDARVACETMATTNYILVAGEITANAKVDYEQIVRDTIRSIGYTSKAYGFSADTCQVDIKIHTQSPDIAMGVDTALEYKQGSDSAATTGAGDQGMMFGFACDETASLMPAPIAMAHALCKRLTDVRESGELPFLRPDGKAQVTVQYDENNRVLYCPAIVVSAQHDEDVSIDVLRDAIADCVIKPVIPEKYIGDHTKFYINPTGRFVLGGPAGDTGLTGRKIIVDAYGGAAAHGGGCFSGKDPTKVDRSAAYMARHIAKNLVAAGLAARCQVELAYAIGVARPVSIRVNTFGTGVFKDAYLSELINEHFDLRPASIISYLDLRRPIYRQTASYGHFGRNDLDLPWERTNAAAQLRCERLSIEEDLAV